MLPSKLEFKITDLRFDKKILYVRDAHQSCRQGKSTLPKLATTPNCSMLGRKHWDRSEWMECPGRARTWKNLSLWGYWQGPWASPAEVWSGGRGWMSWSALCLSSDLRILWHREILSLKVMFDLLFSRIFQPKSSNERRIHIWFTKIHKNFGQTFISLRYRIWKILISEDLCIDRKSDTDATITLSEEILVPRALKRIWEDLSWKQLPLSIWGKICPPVEFHTF